MSEKRRNYIHIQIDKKMYKHLLNLAEKAGVKCEPKETFNEIYDMNYPQIFGQFRIMKDSARTVFFCSPDKFLEFPEFKTIWQYKPRKYLLFEYFRNEPDTNEDNAISHTTGQKAWTIVKNQLLRKYTEQEIIDILHNHQSEYKVDPIRLNIYGYTYDYQTAIYDSEVVYKFDNAYYYDLNKAYASMYIKTFPKIEPWVRKGYIKNKPLMKKIMNYSVGMMVNKDDYMEEYIWPKFRNYIMEEVNHLMNQAFLTVDGSSLKAEVLYANTDGFIINNPYKELPTSQELGEFKEEPIDNREIWFYKHIGTSLPGMGNDQSYTIFQYYENGEKIIKVIGGFRLEPELTEKTDLSKGIVPTFGLTKIAGIPELNKETIEWQRKDIVN